MKASLDLQDLRQPYEDAERLRRAAMEHCAQLNEQIVIGRAQLSQARDRAAELANKLAVSVSAEAEAQFKITALEEQLSEALAQSRVVED